MTKDESYDLWKLLEALDPEMASRWHWKDSRKVLRNLEIIVETGERASDVVKNQDTQPLESRYVPLSTFLLI
jgi:tRNA dimethylallyltransferase